MTHESERKPMLDDITSSSAVEFIESLFAPGDVIAIRPIETWTEDGKKQSKVDYKGLEYIMVASSKSLVANLACINKRAAEKKSNLFFGVCPRFGARDYDLAWQIRKIPALWADVDHASVDDVLGRCDQAGLPRPSIVINSGNGAHVYWLLDQPYLIDDVEPPQPTVTEFVDQPNSKKKARKYIKDADGERLYLDIPRNKTPLSPQAQLVQDVLQGVAAAIGGDHTHDLTRILRLPGTMNRKDERNGKAPVPCVMVYCNRDQRYSFETFWPFADKSPGKANREKIARVPLPTVRRKITSGRIDRLHGLITVCDATPVGQRNEADFALCCWAVENAVDRSEVWSRVEQVGKFAEGGKRYFERTWAAAEQRYREATFSNAGSKSSIQTCTFSADKPVSLSDQEHTDLKSRPSKVELPEVMLPGTGTTIVKTATELGKLLGQTGSFYTRGGAPFRSVRNEKGELILQPHRPAAACSDFENVARLRKQKDLPTGPVIVSTTCSEAAARLIVESQAYRECLPPINVLSPCPVLIERDGQLVQIVGYDRESGIMAGGKAAPEMDVQEAIALISELLLGFRFATDGDRARAVAAFITPALLFGGLLGARAPVDLGEADKSQTGKGYRNKLTAAIYGAVQRTVTQRPMGGVGSVQETFDQAVIAGAQFITLDNFRGRLDLPGIESFLTEDRYLARVPYSGSIEIDPRRTVVSFTSNAAEITTDLANRSSVVRILKQADDHQFQTYPEGDILDHVVANQPKYLGAVFSIITEWHRLGKPTVAAVGHDFRKWAAVLGHIVEHIVEAGPLLLGHRDAQARMASPSLTWLRSVALAVINNNQVGQWLRPNQLLTLIIDARIETPGVDFDADLSDENQFKSATRAVGRKLSTAFTDETMTLDGLTINREKRIDDNYRNQTEYRVTQTAESDANCDP